MQIAKVGMFLKNSVNLLHDRHKILKNDLEIDILLFRSQRQKNNFYVKVANLQILQN